ncbi:MAG: DUF192 domain-containing protein [Gammaproteobacteria bacterium]|nr:DUF192 domain-containing protein [Gammaproteobacteria bacterium]MDH5620252.1 DUF192 domain-containing protein [Gammaproteobacteria bacterium]
MRSAIVVLWLVLAACSPQSAAKAGTVPDLDGVFEFTSLTIVNDAGDRLEFDVYLAREFEQQRRGLMFVRDMPETTGMLFIYDGDEFHSMWMKNTFISLDMVFVRSDGSVSSIITDTTPRTLNSHRSKEPVRYVLELNAGVTRRMNIGQDSRLLWGGHEQ